MLLSRNFCFLWPHIGTGESNEASAKGSSPILLPTAHDPMSMVFSRIHFLVHWPLTKTASFHFYLLKRPTARTVRARLLLQSTCTVKVSGKRNYIWT